MARSRSRRTWKASETQSRHHGCEALKLIIGLYAECKITAKDFAVLCYHLANAGTPGASYDTYGQPPTLQSGKYQAYLNTVLPAPAPLYTIVTPGNWNASTLRRPLSIPFRTAFESIDTELADDPKSLNILDGPDEGRPECALDTQAYKQNTVVVRAREAREPRPLPMGLYVDGINFQNGASGRQDSVVGFWVINLITSKRHLLGCLKDRDGCRCGCKHWCTVYPVQLALRTP